MWLWGHIAGAAVWRHDDGLVASVSSLLIMLLFQPFAKNAVLMGRCISHAVLTFLPRDVNSDGVSVSGSEVRHHRRRCAARRIGGDDDDDALLLSCSDVAAVMASLGMVVMDDDGAWCEAMAVVEEMAASKAAAEDELRDAFGVFDVDGDGFVSAGEVWRVLRRLGMREGARYEDCAGMVDTWDVDGDGRLSFAEFRAMMEDAA